MLLVGLVVVVVSVVDEELYRGKCTRTTRPAGGLDKKIKLNGMDGMEDSRLAEEKKRMCLGGGQRKHLYFIPRASPPLPPRNYTVLKGGTADEPIEVGTVSDPVQGWVPTMPFPDTSVRAWCRGVGVT